jgi:hypothetical protein
MLEEVGVQSSFTGHSPGLQLGWPGAVCQERLSQKWIWGRQGHSTRELLSASLRPWSLKGHGYIRRKNFNRGRDEKS